MIQQGSLQVKQHEEDFSPSATPPKQLSPQLSHMTVFMHLLET